MPGLAILPGAAALAQIHGIKGITQLVEVFRDVAMEEVIRHAVNPYDGWAVIVSGRFLAAGAVAHQRSAHVPLTIGVGTELKWGGLEIRAENVVGPCAIINSHGPHNKA